MIRVCALACALLLALTPLGADAERIIHREKSLYRNIIVTEHRDRRCLVFTVKRDRRQQTCIDLKRPRRVVFAYVRMLLAALLVQPEPKRMLLIGLGGGTISQILAEVYPEMEQDLVEIDPAVIRVAREYFAFENGPNIRVHTQDGRVFTRRAVAAGKTYDLILLDAFTGDYIPEHLMTVEFLSDVRKLLTPHGVLAANTFSSSRLYDHESVTYERAFGPFLNLRMPGTRNRVIVAGVAALPTSESLARQAQLIAPRLAPYSVDPIRFVRRMARGRDWDARVAPLTDQYSPANLLGEPER